MAKHIIFDCDGGSDDAWALLLLLKAEEEKKVVILGVTICGCGNTDLHNAARNILRILKASGRDEIPIFLGAADALITKQETESKFKFLGNDGFGDILPPDHDIDIEEMVEGEHAVAALNQLCLENPKKVTIIAVGPLTNIALCFAMYGKQFANNVKEFYIMGGNHQGVGNFTRSAEFNFYSDPEAAHIVLSKSKCPITILPWEPCMEDRFFVCLKWRLEVLGTQAASFNSAIAILNQVERAQFLPSSFKGWIPCDAMLVAAFLFDSQVIRKQSMWNATIDLRGCHTRGQMVLDHLHEVDKFPNNVRIIELMDPECFKRIVQWAAGVKDIKVEFTDCITSENVHQ